MNFKKVSHIATKKLKNLENQLQHNLQRNKFQIGKKSS
jgi:hypothetical protein